VRLLFSLSFPRSIELTRECQFVTEENAYFKNDKTRDMDRHIGDIYSYITDKEIEIGAFPPPSPSFVAADGPSSACATLQAAQAGGSDQESWKHTRRTGLVSLEQVVLGTLA
jgi:hypothetical protein